MSGVNQVNIMGRLGQDPETRQVGENSVTNFSVATSESWKDKSGEKQEKTEWHRVTMWGKRGDAIQKYFSKGDMIYISGKLQTRSWEDKDGNKRYSTEIVAREFEFCGGSKGGSGSGSNSSPSGNDGPPPDFGGGSADSDIPF